MRSVMGASLAGAAVMAVVFLPGCSKVGKLKAMKSFKAANQAYQQQDYKKSAALYEDVVKDAPDEPDLYSAYFYLGNSYDNQFKPSKKGEAENDALLSKAAQDYQTAAEKLATSSKPEDKKLGKLSLEYLVAVYGPD